MEIIPAIDIRAGKCVRLDQGDYDRETVFGDDPVEMARRWQAAGATRLHVVDLDGARDGKPYNEDVIFRVIRAVDIPIEVGGGMRDVAIIGRFIEAGADRVAIGTAAIKDPTVLLHALGIFGGERILVGVDARNGLVATEGWRETSEVRAIDLIVQIAEMGVRRIFYTDITSDGMLKGPNFPALQEVVENSTAFPVAMAVIASGGVSTAEHVRRLKLIGCEGVIIGKALYTGDLDIADALAAAR
ncbi:MAG: 1-(5-phosphoribosyl)-5-[(5-phosphoribosylamino)methylideneamino]imidazole-4-carboxamide isomerase [Chloroflexota bacterium]